MINKIVDISVKNNWTFPQELKKIIEIVTSARKTEKENGKDKNYSNNSSFNFSYIGNIEELSGERFKEYS